MSLVRVRSFAPLLVAASILGCAETRAPTDASGPPDTALVVPDASAVRDASDPSDALVVPDAATATDAPTARDVAPATCGTDAGGEAPTFRALYADVIGPYRCAECHRAGETWSTLDLSSPEIAYASLVGVVGCDGVTPRVTPCDPSASTLALVPTGRAEPCGGRHTYSGVYPMGIVAPAERDRIDAWIAAGAHF